MPNWLVITKMLELGSRSYFFGKYVSLNFFMVNIRRLVLLPPIGPQLATNWIGKLAKIQIELRIFNFSVNMANKYQIPIIHK